MADARPWQKSSFSGEEESANCVELAAQADVVLLRESDEPARHLRTTPEGLAALIRRVRGPHVIDA
ncbi:DUF397 domain-containing protein [Streptomyces sp. NPDC059063]|uniref:DUF397 domain-containing protein n=1 Tax=unclassified Streptomyces TaxID=2593676 RepID=UPI003697EFFA